MTDYSESKRRVHALRAQLSREGLTGFIIPHTDEFQNEYLPACAERLAWLTGFTGSAGTAVVLQDHAAVFVDGRYVLQVRDQVDLDVFTPQHLSETSISEWLLSVVKSGDVLGYDPWLHTPQDLKPLREVSRHFKVKFIPCEKNPLDCIWTDRPQASATLAVPHAIQYAGQSSEDKRKNLAGKLKDTRVDIAVLTAPDSIAWLFNIRGADVSHTPLALGFAFLRNDESAILFIDQKKVSPELREHLGPLVSIAPLTEFVLSLKDIGKNGGRVLCDPQRTASWIVETLTAEGAEIIKGEDPCTLPKACKNEVEIEGIREAHKRDGAAVCEFLAWLEKEFLSGNVTEIDAQNYLDWCRQQRALWKDQSFPTISAVGSNGAIVHYRATEQSNRLISPNCLYLVDSGGQYLDGTTDITRTVAIGDSTTEQRACYTRVLKGHIALATATFPQGTTGTQLDTLARGPLWEAGLDYDHGTGHGVGAYLGVHEGPQRISKSPSSVALTKGMIISNEPGYYKTGDFGIRLENLVLVVVANTHGFPGPEWFGFETLTVVPFDQSLMDRALLTEKEIEWVNAYHERIWETISPLVNSAAYNWLQLATKPLSLR